MNYTLVGHRGYPSKYPENTCIGIQKAIEHGARAIEFDVQCSRDGTPYVFHDEQLQRLTGHEGIIHQTADSELKQLSAHYPKRFGNQFNGEPIATLEKVVNLLQKHPEVEVFIEPKSHSINAIGVPDMMDAILSISAPIRAQRRIISYHYEALHYAQYKGENIVWVMDDCTDATGKRAQALKPNTLCIDIALLPDTLPAWSQSAELQHAQWMVYPVDDVTQYPALHTQGIHYIETDAIGDALSALA